MKIKEGEKVELPDFFYTPEKAAEEANFWKKINEELMRQMFKINKNMKEEFEKLCEIYEMQVEEFRGDYITHIIRKDNFKRVSLYDIFLDTIQILKDNDKLK